jgi:hypothetical protein
VSSHTPPLDQTIQKTEFAIRPFIIPYFDQSLSWTQIEYTSRTEMGQLKNKTLLDWPLIYPAKLLVRILATTNSFYIGLAKSVHYGFK